MRYDMKNWLAMPALLIVLGVGCDNKQAQTTQDGRTGPAAADPDSADDNATNADQPDPDAATDGEGAPDPIVGGDHPTHPPTPNVDPATDPTPAAQGRSPFPEQGEDLRSPIAAPRLSDHDPFENDIDPEDIPDVVPWEQAGDYVGHEITVEGRIVNVGQTRNADIFFLNFHEDWRGKFYMVIFDDLADTLDQSVAELFEGRLLRVRGLVEPHRGRPQIKILSMEQVEFVEE